MSPSTKLSSSEIDKFETERPRLLGLAYRILGSMSDAEDAVQDTFVKWAKSDRDEIGNPGGWLITVCTRRCLDIRRSGDRARVDYVGAWLPEPIQMTVDAEAESQLEMTSSLSMAFLMMLERLTPRERAAFLLHDIFELPHGDVARTLDISELNSRKLVSRARRNIGQSRIRHSAPPERQAEFLTAFQDAVTDGKLVELTRMLADDARLSADGGGKVAAIREAIVGLGPVSEFISGDLRRYWADHNWVPVKLNGEPGILINHRGKTTAAVTFAYDETGKVREIYIMRNPEKLFHLNAVQVH